MAKYYEMKKNAFKGVEGVSMSDVVLLMARLNDLVERSKNGIVSMSAANATTVDVREAAMQKNVVYDDKMELHDEASCAENEYPVVLDYIGDEDEYDVLSYWDRSTVGNIRVAVCTGEDNDSREAYIRISFPDDSYDDVIIEKGRMYVL